MAKETFIHIASIFDSEYEFEVEIIPDSKDEFLLSVKMEMNNPFLFRKAVERNGADLAETLENILDEALVSQGYEIERVLINNRKLLSDSLLISGQAHLY